jgi:hypothetical protein
LPISNCQISNQKLKIFQDFHPRPLSFRETNPIGAGLGGGSSDAAAALRGLVNLYHITVTEENLKMLAGEIGAMFLFSSHQEPSLSCQAEACNADLFSDNLGHLIAGSLFNVAYASILVDG